jgi:gamma-glutamylcyclotransferase (GGCT)/AIG2-like uncharacterized protein YtfP
MSNTTERLFSYGTLQYPAVQLSTFGRLLEGEGDSLTGHVRKMIAIRDPEVVATSGDTHHPIVLPSNNPTDEVPGMVFAITPDELAAADRYEVAEYTRVGVTLKSGTQAWVYLQAEVPKDEA